MSKMSVATFFKSASIEWQTHPLFPQINIKDLQQGADHPAGAFSLMRVKVAAGSGIDAHSHSVETETAYLLSGTARLICAGECTELRSGEGASIPPGMEHSLAADTEVELLAIHTPPLR